MNATLDSTTLVTAMLWLLALALPLAMLLWMAAQFVALRSLGRRVRALEGAASAAAAGAGAAATAAAALSERPVAPRSGGGPGAEQDGQHGDEPATTGAASAAPPDDERTANDAAEGHA